MKLFCPSCGGKLQNDFIATNPHITTATNVMFICESCASIAAVSFILSPLHHTQLLTIGLTNTKYECLSMDEYEYVRTADHSDVDDFMLKQIPSGQSVRTAGIPNMD